MPFQTESMWPHPTVLKYQGIVLLQQHEKIYYAKTRNFKMSPVSSTWKERTYSRKHSYSFLLWVELCPLTPKFICWNCYTQYHKSEVEVTQSCLTFCDPMDCSLPGSSVHGIFQARILDWVVISYSRGSSWPRDWTHASYVSCTGRQILCHCATLGSSYHFKYMLLICSHFSEVMSLDIKVMGEMYVYLLNTSQSINI